MINSSIWTIIAIPIVFLVCFVIRLTIRYYKTDRKTILCSWIWAFICISLLIKIGDINMNGSIQNKTIAAEYNKAIKENYVLYVDGNKTDPQTINFSTKRYNTIINTTKKEIRLSTRDYAKENS